MAVEDGMSETFADKEHQAAYIFDPSNETGEPVRPAKRRKVYKRHSKEVARPKPEHSTTLLFQPLFDGAEDGKCVGLRQKLFEDSWSRIDERISLVLREANQSTLEDVTSFVQESRNRADLDKIPSAFITTGANIASQELLFEQLSESLQERADAKVVRLRSGDASNLKAALKKIIHSVTARESNEIEDLEVAVGKDGRKYLNYDLESLHAYLKSSSQSHVIVAFQDSEAFETGLLSDLILLFSSWLDRIPFTLLFGVATSVELFQARLLKSTCRHLYGNQFGTEQSNFVIEKIFKTAISHADAPVRLGPSLLQSLLDRQRDQVAGIPVFVSSLKYAFMCHYYSNPLSILLSSELDSELLQKEHLEAVRSLPSFRKFVESKLDAGDVSQVRQLLDDDGYVIDRLRTERSKSHKWVIDVLRHTKVLEANKSATTDFIQLYLDALANGVDVTSENTDFLDSVRRMSPSESISFLTQALDSIKQGDGSLGLDAWSGESEKSLILASGVLAEIKALYEAAEENGTTLRSKYTGQNKVLRTTVVAQKVQLSRDTAALTDEDKAYTELIDRLVEHLGTTLKAPKAEDVFLHEVWLYDSKAPYKDAFVPRPRTVVERALSRPHDYLSCSCCKSSEEDEIMPTLPATAILYHLYLETGSLVNVADLWAAYYGIVGEDNKDGLDERTALVLFYRALSELKAMGFVKQSRKKADHIAKLAWKGL